MALTQPTKIVVNQISINDISWLPNNFHVKELRIYEDICKSYFTGQLVIETMQNVHEYLLGPTVPVFIDFEGIRNDNNSISYSQQFRIHSYESKPIGGGGDANMEHTVQLISQEFYNDRHNTVMQGFSNITGTQAAAQIHNKYLQLEGALRVKQSTGLIAEKDVPHQARNVKPVKAIHDLLDRCVWADYRSCAPVYFKDVDGYVMGPLQYFLEQGNIRGNFYHKLGAGGELQEVFDGYENVIHLRPLTPPGEANADTANFVTSSGNASQYFDIRDGKIQLKPGSIQTILGLPFFTKNPSLKRRVQEMLQEANKSRYGARNMMHIIDQLQQSISVAKHGPGGYNVAQEVFLTALSYCQKWWVSVPIQSGLQMTCGSRMNIVYPIPSDNREVHIQKTWFVPRLIHEIVFTEGAKRDAIPVNATTDMFCVQWEG